MTVELEGFNKATRSGISVTALQNVRADVTLDVGSTAQSVVVEADAPLVESRSNTLGTTIDSERVTEIPLSGRSIMNLASLIPGVSRVSAAITISNSQQMINVNGNRSYSTNMQLDGGSFYFPFRGSGIIMPPPDSMQEIKMATSGMSAEYGRGTAVFSAVTKSGTNQFHGSAWEYLRNDALDARAFFSSSKAMLRQHQFGGTLGGPIIRDKLFFFTSYQHQKMSQQRLSTSACPPTAAERAGDFSGSTPAPVDPLDWAGFP